MPTMRAPVLLKAVARSALPMMVKLKNAEQKSGKYDSGAHNESRWPVTMTPKTSNVPSFKRQRAHTLRSEEQQD